MALQRRVTHPLLPLRVVTDRNRGGSFLAIAVAGAGIFGVFLFLTFYLQSSKGLTPLETGLAFLPMNFSIVITATIVNTRILARTTACWSAIASAGGCWRRTVVRRSRAS